jgi:hypothetical protein
VSSGTKNENKLSTKERVDMTNKWKRVATVVIVVVAFVTIAMKPFKKGEVLKDVLYSSIVWVESKGNANAKSRDGSVGIIQIKPVMVKEVNRICKIQGIDKRFTLADRNNPYKSAEMFWIYQEFYNPDLNLDSLSKEDMAVLARKWNGGPKGHLKRATKKYWKKVSKRVNLELEERNLAKM